MPQGVGALFYEECSSTNTVAGELAAAGQSGPVWITAGTQSAGRGRKGRTWTSETGNLYTSLLLAPNLQAKDLGPIPFIVALAIRDALIATGAPAEKVRCKWPNDVLIGDKKVSGVLIESSAKAGGAIDHLIIGIGVNLTFHPDDALFTATNLKAETGRQLAPKEFLVALSATMLKRFNDWDVHDFSAIREEWSAAAWGLGATRTLNTADSAFEAELIGLDDEGGLVVRLPDGNQRTIVTADVFPVKSGE